MFENYYVGMAAVVVMSYLLGSIPTAFLVARMKKVNIFEVGSGNMGATNVSRSLGLGWGISVMVADMFKGVIAIAIAQMIMPDSKAAATTISAISAIVGHNWSLGATLLTGTLRGGKGAATAFGTLLMIAPLHLVVATAVIGTLIVARTRYVSLAVLTTFTLSILWLIVLVMQGLLPLIVLPYAVVLAALLIIRFRGNIQRLLDGTERRLGERA